MTYRELLLLARERLGPAAAALKTRDELERALGFERTVPPADEELAVVTSDFFIAHQKSGAKK